MWADLDFFQLDILLFSVQKMFVAVVYAMGNSDRMQKNDW
jgi:hypothetical protein